MVQDVFLRVWRRPGSFDARRGELGTYLRLMARSRALDLWREGQAAGRASDRLKLVVDGAPPPVEDSPAAVAELDATRETVIEALQQLPEPQREALVLAYWGGLTAGQIADREQVPLGTAKSRIRLGLARLRQECPALAHGSRLTERLASLEHSFDSAEPAGQDAWPGGGPMCAVAGVAACRPPQATTSDAAQQPKEDLVLRPKLDWRAAVCGGALVIAYACAAAVPAPAPADTSQGTPTATASKVGVTHRR